MDTNINRTTTIKTTTGYPVDNVDRESWKVMFDHLTTDLARLFEQEKLLIRTEVKEIVTEAKVAVGSMVVGGALLAVGGLALVATIIIVLAQFMPLWGSAALVTAVLLVVGFVMVNGAKRKLTADKITPRQSIETMGEIKTTFKERFNEFKQHH